MLRTRLRAGGLTAVILAMTFSLGFVLIASADLFISSLRFQAGRPAPVTIRIPSSSVFTLTGTEVELAHRGIILPRGTIATDPLLVAQLEAFERARRPPGARPGIYIGLFVLCAIFGLLLSTQLRRLGSRGELLRTQVAIFALLLVGMGVGKAFLLLTPWPELYLPVAILPLWTALFVDRRAAILVAPAASILAAALLGFDIGFLAVMLAQSFVAVATLHDFRHPREIVTACVKAALVAAVVHVCVMLVFSGRFDVMGDLRRWRDSGLIASVCGALAAGVLAFVFASFASRILGGVSRARLLELAELDQPLLEKMAQEAPGSFAHARAMANLAEAAAQAIDADALLVRIGAYYHDLGKTVQPKYFIENLDPGEESPHTELEPDVSADAIMAHVVEGTKILRRGGIPEPVVEFAYTHHGTSVVEYFWNKCIAQGNPKSRSVEQFRYPGMKPQTRETAILMIVDAIEAASRTINPPTREGFEQVIYRTIYSKIRQTQLDESGMTIEDIHRVCETLIDTLVTGAHGRIAYPWQLREAAAVAAAADAAALVPPPEDDEAPASSDADEARDTVPGETLLPEGDLVPEPDEAQTGDIPVPESPAPAAPVARSAVKH
jgi:cyclic-di-AMP phosphodiesterase PgpH